MLLRGSAVPLRYIFHCRGFGGVARALAVVFGDATLTVRVLDKFDFKVRVTDAYWLSSVLTQTLYESELFPLFNHLRQYRCGFIDGGANLGWWSVIAESLMGWKCVAIEAARDLLPLIDANRRANGCRFEILNRILWRGDGQELFFDFDPIKHAGGHVNLERSGTGDPGRTISLDAAVSDHLENAGFHPDLLLVKIDVEGAESAVLAGAERALQSHDVLMVYEDHGGDITCAATAAMLEHGLRVYSIADDGALVPISDVASARAIKRAPTRGYNFLAVKHLRLADDAIASFMQQRACVSEIKSSC
jgi:FkbM family methyltransferase